MKLSKAQVNALATSILDKINKKQESLKEKFRKEFLSNNQIELTKIRSALNSIPKDIREGFYIENKNLDDVFFNVRARKQQSVRIYEIENEIYLASIDKDSLKEITDAIVAKYSGKQ